MRVKIRMVVIIKRTQRRTHVQLRTIFSDSVNLLIYIFSENSISNMQSQNIYFIVCGKNKEKLAQDAVNIFF